MKNEEPTKIEIGDDELTVTKKYTVPLETAGIKGYDRAYETIDGFIIAKKNGEWFQLDTEGIFLGARKIGKEELKKWIRTLAIPSNEWKPEYAELPVKGIGKLIDNRKELLKEEIREALEKMFLQEFVETTMEKVEIKNIGNGELRAKIEERKGTSATMLKGLQKHFPVQTQETEEYSRKIEILGVGNEILFSIKEE